MGGYREVVANGRVTGNIALQSAGRSEALHGSFTLSERQMAVFGAVIQTLVRPVLKAGRDLALRSTIGSQFVRHDPFGQAMAFDQPFQQPFCGPLVTPGLNHLPACAGGICDVLLQVCLLYTSPSPRDA